MTYVFMANHYPKPGRQADLYRRMADHVSSAMLPARLGRREYLHLTQPAR